MMKWSAEKAVKKKNKINPVYSWQIMLIGIYILAFLDGKKINDIILPFIGVGIILLTLFNFKKEMGK